MKLIAVAPCLANCDVAFCLVAERLHEVGHMSFALNSNILGNECTVGIVYMEVDVGSEYRVCRKAYIYSESRLIVNTLGSVCEIEKYVGTVNNSSLTVLDLKFVSTCNVSDGYIRCFDAVILDIS